MAALIGLALLSVVASNSDVMEAAEAAGVDPVDLAGAVNTTGLDPWTYLRRVGEFPTSQPAFPNVWVRLAACESNGRWSANTGNGYYGGLQEDMTFWRRHGGLAYASRPDLASPSAQIAVAERGLVAQGWSAWPVCSRRIGVR